MLNIYVTNKINGSRLQFNNTNFMFLSIVRTNAQVIQTILCANSLLKTSFFQQSKLTFETDALTLVNERLTRIERNVQNATRDEMALGCNWLSEVTK